MVALWLSTGNNPLGQRRLIAEGIGRHHLRNPCSALSTATLLLVSAVTLEGTSSGP